jgi:hypothetical protein
MRVLLICENNGLPAEICQFSCCVPWIEKYKHDAGAERGGVQNALWSCLGINYTDKNLNTQKLKGAVFSPLYFLYFYINKSFKLGTRIGQNGYMYLHPYCYYIQFKIYLKGISSLFFLAEGMSINLIWKSAGNVLISITTKRIADPCHDLSWEEGESVAVSRLSVAYTCRLQNRRATYVTACWTCRCK